MACEAELERLEAARELLKDLTDYQNARGLSKLACAIAWFWKYGLLDPTVTEVNREVSDARRAYWACMAEAGYNYAKTTTQNTFNSISSYIS